MLVLKTKTFARFARRERIKDDALIEAVTRAGTGLVDADLGSGLIKQRVARPGKGRSGGYRTIIAYRSGDLAVFLRGFAKSEQDNIGPDDLATLKDLAIALLAASEAQIGGMVDNQTLIVIDQEDDSQETQATKVNENDKGSSET